MTLIGHTMMCEQAGPKQLAQKAATMQLLSDGRFTLGLAQARISTNTLPAGNGRTQAAPGR
jgi:alkanesulfonate monooxygenase SsuD/methylene tetrahydromethanopterin reductase-like flavin-dependent oxidoreductase (luciferase family)